MNMNQCILYKTNYPKLSILIRRPHRIVDIFCMPLAFNISSNGAFVNSLHRKMHQIQCQIRTRFVSNTFHYANGRFRTLSLALEHR